MLFLTVVSCGSLDDPINGRVTTTGTTYQGTATYTCDTGYTRSGDQTRVCQANGDWSGSEPVCNREYDHQRKSNYYQYFSDDFMSYITKCYFCSVICRNVQVPPNGVVTYSDLTIPRAVGSTVTYSCVFGYEFSGGMPRTCSVSGWSNGGNPTCTG